MRRSSLIFISLLLFTSSAFAKDEFVAIAGTVGNFHTDVRILNPSFDKDIVVNATFLPIGNTDNNGRPSVPINVPKRSMKVLDDIVSNNLSASGLGGILFSSGDDFEVTSRIYAVVPTGTLGQFSPGLQPGAALKKGAILQIKSTPSPFRTNIGAVNPSNSNTTVTWRLYDKNNTIIATGAPIVMPPYAVIGPTNITSGFFFNTNGADLSDAWVSYVADQPIFAYASVIDNGTTDPTFIPASPDTGVAPTTQPTGKVFDVTEHSFNITWSPVPNTLAVGDTVTVHVHAFDSTHGFSIVSPSNKIIVEGFIQNPGESTDRTFTIPEEGTYTYFCVNPACGTGHGNMVGTFTVGKDDGGDPGRGY